MGAALGRKPGLHRGFVGRLVAEGVFMLQHRRGLASSSNLVRYVQE